MQIERDDLLTIDEKKYIVLSVLSYDGEEYAFTNYVEDEDKITDEFYILKTSSKNVEFVNDGNLVNVLLPKFEISLKEQINEIKEELESVG